MMILSGDPMSWMDADPPLEWVGQIAIACAVGGTLMFWVAVARLIWWLL